jgi:hypothetical protein
MFEIRGAGAVQSAIHNRAMLGENFAPVRQKLRVVVLTVAVGLEARPNVYMHALGVLALG